MRFLEIWLKTLLNLTFCEISGDLKTLHKETFCLISWLSVQIFFRPFTVEEGTIDTCKITPHLLSYLIRLLRNLSLKIKFKVMSLPQTSNSPEISVKWDVWEIWWHNTAQYSWGWHKYSQISQQEVINDQVIFANWFIFVNISAIPKYTVKKLKHRLDSSIMKYISAILFCSQMASVLLYSLKISIPHNQRLNIFSVRLKITHIFWTLLRVRKWEINIDFDKKDWCPSTNYTNKAITPIPCLFFAMRLCTLYFIETCHNKSSGFSKMQRNFTGLIFSTIELIHLNKE